MHRTTLALATLLTYTFVSIGHADVVDPAPESCPPGSTPSSSHSGPLCSPTPECTATTTCTGGASCMAVSQCIEQRSCGGRLPPDSGPCFVENVLGPCGADGSCRTGTCRQRSVCATAAEVSPGGCGCRASAPSTSTSTLGLLTLLGLLLGVRRRAARARRPA